MEDIRDVLARHGFSFKKKFGQNFLTDGNLLDAIVRDAGADKETAVLEIGAGAGALTRALSAAPMHMGQGSSVTYRSQSFRRQLFSFLQARSMAYISACELAICVCVRRLYPEAMTLPSNTITAPTGTSSAACPFFACASASRI